MATVIDRLEHLHADWLKAEAESERDLDKPAAEGMTADAVEAVDELDNAVRAVLPDLLKLARATDALADLDCATLGEEVIAGPDGQCVICAINAARVALFGEAKS